MTTDAPRSVSIRLSAQSSAGCVVTAASGRLAETRFALMATRMPGVTQLSPPNGASTSSSARRTSSGE